MDKITFHFLIIALTICYVFIRGRKLITKNPIGLIASSLYFFRFFVPSYWISSGLFNFNGIPTFNYDLYSMYLSALIITILTLEISINFKLFQFQFHFKRKKFHKGYKHIFYIIICIIIYYWIFVIDIPLFSENVELARNTLVYEDASRIYLIIVNIINLVLPGLGAFLITRDRKSSQMIVLLMICVFSTMYIGRKSGILLFFINTFILYHISIRKFPNFKRILLISSLSVVILFSFYRLYGYSDPKVIASSMFIRAGVLESASSYFQYKKYYDIGEPKPELLNLPLSKLYFGEKSKDIRIETYTVMHKNKVSESKVSGNAQTFSLLLLSIGLGKLSGYIVFTFLILSYFIFTRIFMNYFPSHSLPHWISGYYLLSLGHSYIGVNIFSIFTSTFINIKLTILILFLVFFFQPYIKFRYDYK